MQPYEPRYIINRQTAALESAVGALIVDRQALFECSSNASGAVDDDQTRSALLRMDFIIKQCKTALIRLYLPGEN